MPDFTSALYLGLGHPSAALRPWERLSLGRPAALEELPGAARAAADLAALQGSERGVLLPSTLHLFLDLFEVLAEEPIAVCADAGVYPVARWGVERAALAGMPVRNFRHHDAESLRRALADIPGGRRPIVVADGYCPACGGPAPLADYLAEVRRRRGLLVIDDTQALGVLGRAPSCLDPYGRGGGGSLRLAELAGPDILVGASLAKGFGAPVAVLSGSAALIGQFLERSSSRFHCSPPSAAAIHAVERALAINRAGGDALRRRLAQRVRQFRAGLRRLGLDAEGGLFPVQVLRPVPGLDPARLLAELACRGVRAVPLRGRNNAGARLGFLLTAAHRPDEIESCLSALAAACSRNRRPDRRPGPPTVPAHSLWR
jgi:8-amino-7-oxononanoate synthase